MHDAIQAIIGLALITAGLALVSIPVALIVLGLLIFVEAVAPSVIDATRGG